MRFVIVGWVVFSKQKESVMKKFLLLALLAFSVGNAMGVEKKMVPAPGQKGISISYNTWNEIIKFMDSTALKGMREQFKAKKGKEAELVLLLIDIHLAKKKRQMDVATFIHIPKDPKIYEEYLKRIEQSYEKGLAELRNRAQALGFKHGLAGFISNVSLNLSFYFKDGVDHRHVALGVKYFGKHLTKIRLTLKGVPIKIAEASIKAITACKKIKEFALYDVRDWSILKLLPVWPDLKKIQIGQFGELSLKELPYLQTKDLSFLTKYPKLNFVQLIRLHVMDDGLKFIPANIMKLWINRSLIGKELYLFELSRFKKVKQLRITGDFTRSLEDGAILGKKTVECLPTSINWLNITYPMIDEKVLFKEVLKKLPGLEYVVLRNSSDRMTPTDEMKKIAKEYGFIESGPFDNSFIKPKPKPEKKKK